MNLKTRINLILPTTNLVIMLLTSCGLSSKGKILKRGKCISGLYSATWVGAENSQRQFLVNNSSSEIITFTLKVTHTSRLDRNNNKLYETSTVIETETYTLNPGQEKEVECEKFVFYNDREVGRIQI